MRYSVFVLLLTPFIAACQPPVVPLKSYSFNVKFDVNGKLYEVNEKFKCHYEDVSWISTKGAEWHIREGTDMVRGYGAIDNDVSFEIIPKQPWPKSFCFDSSGPVDVQVFIKKKNGLVESFDKNRVVSSSYNFRLVDARINLRTWGVGFFEKKHKFLELALKPYYAVSVNFYGEDKWGRNEEAADFVDKKKIIWFEKNKAYPFKGWGRDDMEFSRLRWDDDGLKADGAAAEQSVLKPKGDVWIISASNIEAINWLQESTEDESEKGIESASPEKRSSWVNYKGSKIEVPIRLYERIFYEPEENSLVEFVAQTVELR
ncbi:hypothetical protein HA052_15125 [Chromobacterium haemolyticum]|uniref:Uncharacterized protein n=1 Tax=Chromobacterium fluminis TaxID=3044269 RepID=A0ABX0LBB7_9NEIS|nr:hypothetical protein [Chromobacterium haemolyticum]NHR06523.1 hypothetical protein [Chromobacterium haemolyticum]